jgi:hypothetical protein
MLSTNYRLRLEFICSRIATRQPVELKDRVWATKLGEKNSTAATMLRQAQRKAQKPDMRPGDTDDFLNQLDLGDADRPHGIRGFNGADEIADFFRRDNDANWRQRD